MYITSQYQYIQNLLKRFYKEEEKEVTNDKIAKIIKQRLFMTNQKLWESQFAFDEIRPDRDSLYSIVELLDETFFTLDVQEKKHLDHQLHDARHCTTDKRPLTLQTTVTDEEFLRDGGFS